MAQAAIDSDERVPLVTFLLGEATKAAALRTISNQANSGDLTHAIALGTTQTHSSLPSARKACAWRSEPNRVGGGNRVFNGRQSP